jgi:hypothetical protein
MIRLQWKQKENQKQLGSLDNAITAYQAEWGSYDEGYA